MILVFGSIAICRFRSGKMIDPSGSMSHDARRQFARSGARRRGVRQTLVVDWASLAADLPGRLTEDLRLSKQRAVRSLLGGKLLGTTD
jgi:hypothetical protein